MDFLSVDDTEEYRDFGILHSIYLGDAVRVVVPRLGLTVALRMTQYTYDCLLRKYTACTLGTALSMWTAMMWTARPCLSVRSNKERREQHDRRRTVHHR